MKSSLSRRILAELLATLLATASVLIGVAVAAAPATESRVRAFAPGEIWNDVAGKAINAHGGGMLFHEGVYYWYGEFKEGRTWAPAANRSWGGTRVVAMGVSCYSSTNLSDWKFEGLALPAVTKDRTHDLHNSKVIERPKVIYNRATKKFVMWLHIDSEDYSAARSGVAVSDSPTGPFKYLGSFRPNAGVWPEGATPADKQAGRTNALARDFKGGQMARDMTLFVDDDGKAYQFYSSEGNPTMHVSQLSDDYLKPAGKYRRIFVGRSMEAPAVFKRNGKYYLIASGCTGWAPNAARSAVADSPMGPWTELGNPWEGAEAETSFNSQSTYVLPVQGLPETFIFMADRWNSTNLPDSRYLWLPLRFDADGRPKIRWEDKWSLPQTKIASAAKHTFAIGTNDFLLDGQRFQIRCGEIHAPRVPPEYWRHRLQMAKAMGLNTVCAYLFWNLHEPQPGKFNWADEADAAQFCRIAQEEGLWVILRPGPYACAEWEMGGTPWWLLKEDGVKFRTRDPRYIEAAKRYFKEVSRVLGPLQITRGGPILMVQVENEYGFFGKDADYMGELRQVFIDAGFDVPLFACNPKDHLKDGWRADLFPVVNFGSDPAGAFKALRQILPQGPLMCGEFYPGWFDTWGQPHHTGKTDKYLADLDYMLKAGASFSIYMAHGGTTFGLWGGCDRPFKPDTSSYDYDAPISEAGWTTDKFFKTRELFAKHLLPGETIPEPPAKNSAISFAPVAATQVAAVFDNLPASVSDLEPRAMEKYDQGFGCILYRTTIQPGDAAWLEAAAIHDFGYVFLDGERIGVLDRRAGSARLALPARALPAKLDVLVEPMGRVNFGPEMRDPKGLIAPVKLGGVPLLHWKVFSLPLDSPMLAAMKYNSTNAASPAFWRTTFHLEKPGDTFLDLRNWGKGVVWVNGHCLARFWNIGPSQTAYLPGCWLRAGINEIVIWDLLGPTKPEITGLEAPILDQLRPELDFAKSHRPQVTLKLDGLAPTYTGTFAPGNDTQEIKFNAAASGKFFCLESLNAQDGKPHAAIAELDLLDASGKPLSHDGWTIAYVDSEEREREDGTAENAIDGQTANLWHTQWGSASPNHPHRLVLDLGKTLTVSGFRYVPRQSAGGGRIKDYRVFVGDFVTPGQ
ncbi:MAG: beta-galactosidase [Verrucomicrobia bacterium]|nr:MAG: beta-galactosidase [Verrucomicrobiota bacterium]